MCKHALANPRTHAGYQLRYSN